MAIVERLEAEEIESKTIGQVYSYLGERDTALLYEKSFKIDFDHDIPTGAGNSIDRKTVYVDRTLYEKVMDGEYKVANVSPRNIITAWIIHEHSEKVIIDGSNPVDHYQPAHQCALAKEHEFIRFLGGKIDKYEEAIWPGLEECYKHNALEKVPADLWCAPLMDYASEHDLELIKKLIKLGVADATKQSKYDVNYSIGQNECRNCSMFQPDKLKQEGGDLALCAAVGGLVRKDRWCSLFKLAKGK